MSLHFEWLNLSFHCSKIKMGIWRFFLTDTLSFLDSIYICHLFFYKVLFQKNPVFLLWFSWLSHSTLLTPDWGVKRRFLHQAILWHQLGVLKFNSILILSAWRQHQIPQVKGSVPWDFPAPQVPVISSRSPGYPQLVQLGYRLKIPMTSSVLEWLFGRTAHRIEGNTYVYQFIKECDKGYRWTATCSDICGKVWEGPKYTTFCPSGVRAHCPLTQGYVQQLWISLNFILLACLWDLIMYEWLIINSLSNPSPFLKKWGMGLKISSF